MDLLTRVFDWTFLLSQLWGDYKLLRPASHPRQEADSILMRQMTDATGSHTHTRAHTRAHPFSCVMLTVWCVCVCGFCALSVMSALLRFLDELCRGGEVFLKMSVVFWRQDHAHLSLKRRRYGFDLHSVFYIHIPNHKWFCRAVQTHQKTSMKALLCA